MRNFFDKEKYVLHYENLQLYLRLVLKLKKIHRLLEFNQSQLLKLYVQFSPQKRIEVEKNGEKDEKTLYKLMNNGVYRKTMENLRNGIDVNNEKDYLKWTSKLSYMSQKIFENDLAMMRKCKVILTLKKPAYVGVCILELTEALMDELHYNYIKNEYGSKSRLLFIDTDSSMYEIYV